jgi:imidazole glycerol-phosphate synthase subunit HisH
MIAIVDYKMGNIKSLKNAMDFLGADCCVTSKADEILNAEKIILPGVGAFNIAMKNLKELDLVEVLNRAVFEKNISILGICLGMQIFAARGEENELVDGLGWIKGTVKRFSDDLRIPHIGFNEVDFKNKSLDLFSGIENGANFYFVHSYHIICEEPSDAIAWTDYGEKFVSIVRRGNITGVQFHPEKSQSNGLVLLKNFILS